MFVQHCMSTPVITIRPEAPVQQALELMQENGIRRLPVVDSRGHLAGIVSERDLLQAGPSSATSLSVWEISYLLSRLTVQQVMTRAIIITTPETPIEYAASLMLANKIGGLPVVNSKDRVVGIITETDIFRVFVEILDGTSQGLRLSLTLQEDAVPFQLLHDLHEVGAKIVAVGSVPGGENRHARRHAVVVVEGIDQHAADTVLRKYDRAQTQTIPDEPPQIDRNSLVPFPAPVGSGV